MKRLEMVNQADESAEKSWNSHMRRNKSKEVSDLAFCKGELLSLESAIHDCLNAVLCK